MNISIIAFTAKGLELARGLQAKLIDDATQVDVTCGFGPEKVNHHDWTAERFATRDALVFVGATGIAVRSIAPHLVSKGTDPAVIVIDEAAQFCTPIVSGHIGGANALAQRIAAVSGAQPVVSTASDVSGAFAIDSWAVSQGLKVRATSGIKCVTSKLLAGQQATVVTELPIANAVPEGIVVTEDGQADAYIGIHGHDEGLDLIAPCAVLGIGCRRGTEAERIEAAAAQFLADNGIAPEAVSMVASIDLKADEAGLVAFAQAHELPFVTFSSDQLNALEGDFTESEFVESVTGSSCVCERSSVAAGGKLLIKKTVIDSITFALSVKDMPLNWQGAPEGGRLTVVGLGPGNREFMTQAAIDALVKADLVAGYTKYIELAQAVVPNTPTLKTGMTKEIDRCRAALQAAAEGKRVAMVCSGDSGVYGMAGLCMELANEFPPVPIDVVCGVTAALSGASVLGAPLTHDFAVISLSDLLTPWDKIELRLETAAKADFCVALYNPASHKRKDYLQRAVDILLRGKKPETICGVVRNIGRDGQEYWTGTLEQLRDFDCDMFCTVFIGNEQTKVIDDRMVTPRGYYKKAEWNNK